MLLKKKNYANLKCVWTTTFKGILSRKQIVAFHPLLVISRYDLPGASRAQPTPRQRGSQPATSISSGECSTRISLISGAVDRNRLAISRQTISLKNIGTGEQLGRAG